MRNEENTVYKVTEARIARNFKVINDQVFGGLLELSDIDEIDIDFLDTEWGYCVDEGNEIILGMTNEFPSVRDFLNTLCHEMIHLYQIMNDEIVDHGETFESFAQWAKKLGYVVD